MVYAVTSVILGRPTPRPVLRFDYRDQERWVRPESTVDDPVRIRTRRRWPGP